MLRSLFGAAFALTLTSACASYQQPGANEPGATVELRAVMASTQGEAAKYYVTFDHLPPDGSMPSAPVPEIRETVRVKPGPVHVLFGYEHSGQYETTFKRKDPNTGRERPVMANKTFRSCEKYIDLQAQDGQTYRVLFQHDAEGYCTMTCRTADGGGC